MGIKTCDNCDFYSIKVINSPRNPEVEIGKCFQDDSVKIVKGSHSCKYWLEFKPAAEEE